MVLSLTVWHWAIMPAGSPELPSAWDPLSLEKGRRMGMAKRRKVPLMPLPASGWEAILPPEVWRQLSCPWHSGTS